ncbi:MAG: hypothetical protein ACOVNL_03610 [Prochlorococcaceae cyanobacterium]|jgi:hypothetical protein
MARPSIALFLAAAGLMAATAGCGKTEAPGGEEGGGSPAMTAPAPGGAMPQEEGKEEGDHGDEGGEGGEGGEG